MEQLTRLNSLLVARFVVDNCASKIPIYNNYRVDQSYEKSWKKLFLAIAMAMAITQPLPFTQLWLPLRNDLRDNKQNWEKR